MNPDSGHPGVARPPARVPALPLAALWLAVGLLFAAHEYFSDGAEGRAISIWRALYWSLSEWGAWAILTPLIVRLAWRVPLAPPRLARAVAIHAAAGLGFAGAQVLGQATLDWVVVGLSGDPGVSIVTWLSGWAAEASATLEYLVPRKLGFNYFIYWVVLAVGHVWGYYRLAEARAIESNRLAAALAQSRLEALTARLKPHFLFNTLNAISELIHENPGKAEQMLDELGGLLRRAVGTEARRAIPLREEVESMNQYLGIQQTRFGDRLEVNIDVAPSAAAALVPPDILQPLVENAIEHGAAAPGVPTRIEVAAARRGDWLVVTVRDGGPGPSLPVVAGTGLQGTQARLEILYGPEGRLQLTRAPEGGAVATIEVPWLQ